MYAANQKSSSVSVLVSSYDGASDLWEPFFLLFDKFWPTCPFQVYLVSNFKDGPNKPYLKTVKAGRDLQWASNIKKILNHIPSEYILYLQDDYFLDRSVDDVLLLEGLSFLSQHHGAHLRLMPSPRPDINIPNNKKFGNISLNAKYRACLQAGIWNKKIFVNLIREGENAWEMEFNGTERAKKIKEPFFSFLGTEKDKRKNIPLSYFFVEPVEDVFFTCVNRGVWLYEALQFIKFHGYNPYPTNRLVCTAAELYKHPEVFYESSKKPNPIKYNFLVQECIEFTKNLMNLT